MVKRLKEGIYVIEKFRKRPVEHDRDKDEYKTKAEWLAAPYQSGRNTRPAIAFDGTPRRLFSGLKETSQLCGPIVADIRTRCKGLVVLLVALGDD